MAVRGDAPVSPIQEVSDTGDEGCRTERRRPPDLAAEEYNGIGTAELESVVIEHHSVAESAVIGVPHEIKGQGLVAFVTVKEGKTADEKLEKEIRSMKLGNLASPRAVGALNRAFGDDDAPAESGPAPIPIGQAKAAYGGGGDSPAPRPMTDPDRRPI